MTTSDTESRIRDPGGLWAWMRFFVALTNVFYFTAATSSALTWAVVAGILHVTTPQANVIDITFAITVFGCIGLYFISAFCTARVTFRLMKNAHALESDEQLISPGWAVGWYFIPFANLVMPARAVGQIWRTTFKHRGEPEKGSAIIGWWWASWLISGLVLSASDAIARANGTDMPGPELYLALVFGYALRGICGWLLLAVFGQLVRAQKSMDAVADVFS
jgi:hypothetical protein